MKHKKFLSIILTMVMAISLLPTFTFTVAANNAGNALPVGNAAISTQITDFGTSPAGDSQDSVFMKISDSELLLLYIADADGRVGKDKPALYYSIYTNSAWSTPQILEDDGTADSHPYAYDMGDGRIFVAWSSAEWVHDNNKDEAYFLHSFNIKSAFFNKMAKTFDKPLQVTKNIFTTTPEVNLFAYEVPVTALYDSDSSMLMLVFTASEYSENYIGNIYTTICSLFYDGEKGRWLNNFEDYSEEEQRDFKRAYEDYTAIDDYLKINYGTRYFDVDPRVNADGSEFSAINDPNIYKICNNRSMFSFLSDNVDRHEHFITTGQYDFAAKKIKALSTGLITNESCVSTKICYDGLSGLLFAGFADESGDGGTIECYGFYFKDGVTPDNLEYKAWYPADENGFLASNWLTNKVAAVHTDNITGFSVFEDGTDKYLVYSESDENGAEIRTIKLRSSLNGENLITECTPCELTIAKIPGENNRCEILEDCVQDGKIDLLCRLNGSEIRRISHTPSANIELAELKFETENPQPGDTVNAVAVVRNSGFEKYSGTFNVDFSAKDNASATVPHTADIESGETVEVKYSVTIPTETKNVTVSASIGSDKKEIALQYIFMPKASDFTFTPPSDLTYDNSAKTAGVTADKSGMGAVKVKYYDESGVETEPKNAGTYTVKIDVAAGTDYAAANDLTADGWKFTVEQKNISEAKVGAFAKMEYDGKEKTPSATVEIDGLTATGEWSKVKNVGDKTTFTANGNFVGKISDVEPNMAKLPVEIEWKNTDGLVYDGKAKTVTAKVSNKCETDEVSLTLGGDSLTQTEQGTYNAKVTAVDNDNYTVTGGQNLEKEWSIEQASDNVITGFAIVGWTYGDTANAPTSAAKYGTPEYGYSSDKDGTYTNTAPTDAGTYWVKATVAETKNFKEVSSEPISFDIAKATPTESKQTTARVLRGGTLANAVVTNGEIVGIDGITALEGVFAWVDDTKTMSADGTEQMTFTPNDTNYAPITLNVSVGTYLQSSGGGSSATRYTVKFDTDGGDEVASQTVAKNGTASEPANPTKDGFVFGGWYTDNKFASKYNFNAKVTKNITLYAKWTEDEIQEPSDDKKDDEQKPNDEPQTGEWENPFTDVFDTDWFFNSVKYANENGLMSGTTNTTFAPNLTLTRGMLVTILYRLAGEPAVNKSIPFADVTADSYYRDAVIWAQQNGIVSGISETEFAPDANITREQIAVILYRYAIYKGYDVTQGGMQIREFEDFESISDYALTAMTWAVNTGLMKGKTETTLNPKDNATRAEIAAIFQRFIEANK